LNTIWSLNSKGGKQTRTFEELPLMGTRHFQNLFTAPLEVSLAELIRTTQAFPRYADEGILWNSWGKSQVGRLKES